jgi:hypothetical protein
LLSGLIIALTADVSLERVEVNDTRFTLPNGSNVTLHDDHTVPFTCVDVWYSEDRRRQAARSSLASRPATPRRWVVSTTGRPPSSWASSGGFSGNNWAL